MDNSIQPQKANIRVVIKEKELSVAPEGKVEFHIGAINSGTMEDIVKFSVKGIPTEWVSFDEPELRVEAGKAKQVILQIQPPPFPDGRVGKYKLEIQGTSRNAPRVLATIRCTVNIAAYAPEGHVGVLIGAIDFPVTPGSSVSIPLLLENRGISADSFRFNISGIPRSWVSTTSSVIQLAAGESKEMIFTINLPRSSTANAGRTPFKIQVSSEEMPSQKTEIDCILTVSAFSKFSGILRPEQLRTNQPAQLLISNEGNTIDTYNLSFQDLSGKLLFEKITRYAKEGSDPNNPEIGFAYSEITSAQRLRVSPGESGVFEYRSRLRSRSFVGDAEIYYFNIKAVSAEKKSLDFSSQIKEKGFFPPWLLVLLLITFMALCLILFIPKKRAEESINTTQTAVYHQSQAVIVGKEDMGELLDGQEKRNCSLPFIPDTDADKFVDGSDIDPCDPNNPSITATTIAEIPTDTSPPTLTLTPVSPIASLVSPTASPTPPKPVEPNLKGLIVFESNRDGNAEIYVMNAFDQTVTRLTNNAAVDIQPVLAPNALEIAYVTNQDGNNEIYLTGVDRRTPMNLTNNLADDQYPAWSPDGNWVAFTSNRDGNFEIYVMRSDGSELRNISNHPEADTEPAWFSSDSSGSQDWIVFASNRDGNQEIYKVKPDGSGLTNLTNNLANDYSPAGYNKGNLLAFVSDRDGNPEVYVMGTDGSAQRNLTNNPYQDIEPTFKANEGWIAFSTNRDGNLEIYFIQDNGMGVFNMSRNPIRQDRHPDWR